MVRVFMTTKAGRARRRMLGHAAANRRTCADDSDVDVRAVGAEAAEMIDDFESDDL